MGVTDNFAYILQVTGGNGGSDGGGGGGGGRVYINAPTTFSFNSNYQLSGGSSAQAEAGGAGIVYEYTKINLLPNTRIYTDNTGATSGGSLGQRPAKTYFSEGNSITKTYDQMYVGKEATLFLDGTSVMVQVNSLSCDKDTAVVEVPDYTVFEAEKGQVQAVIECSFHLSEEGELRMPSSVTLTGSSNQFAGKMTKPGDINWHNYSGQMLSPLCKIKV